MIYNLGDGIVVELNLSVLNSWNGGFVTKATMKNISAVPLSDWSLELDLASGITLANTANGSFEQNGSIASITPEATWLETVSPGEEISFTFRSDGNVTDVASDVSPTAIFGDTFRYTLEDMTSSGGGLTADLNVKSTWGNGAWLQIKLENMTASEISDWQLPIKFPAGMTFSNSNAVDLVDLGGGQFALVPTQAAIESVQAGETIAFGFAVQGDPATVTDIMLGDPDDMHMMPDDGFEIGVVVTSTWATGAFIQITLENGTGSDLTEWQLPVTVPAGMTIEKSGAVDIVDLGGGQYLLTPKKENIETIEAGDTIALGLTLKGDPADIPNIMIDDPTGMAPPEAVNDLVTNYAFNSATGEISFNVSDILANDAAGATFDTVSKVAGGGTATVQNNKIFYTSAPDDAGRIVLSYEISDSDGLTSSAQVAFDMPTPPALNVGDITVNEATGVASFDVTLTGPLYRDTVEVDYQTRERSAKDGDDFTGETGTLSFTDANRTQTVTVDLIDNFAKEFSETFDLVLTNPRGAIIENHAGEATITEDPSDTGVIGTTTPGLSLGASLLGEFVVGYTTTIAVTNTSGATMTENPIITVGVEDGMALVQGAGGRTEDGKSIIRANHDDRYFTLEVDLSAPFLGPDLADGTFDAGDTLSLDLFFSGAHFFKPLAERIELAPTTFEFDQPTRDFVPLDLTYKGFNTTFFNRAEDSTEGYVESLDEVQAIGGNSTAIVTTHFMETKASNTISAGGFTMSDSDLIDAIRAAKAEGLDVLLKPHLDVDDKTFRGRIDPQDEATFFGRQPDGTYAADSYGELIMRYAAIAEAEGADVFLIGTELVDLAKNRANLPYWTDLIADVRSVYSGDLSYASIVGEELFVRFWDQLDLISLDIYPPLTDNLNPSVGELIDGWTETPTNERSLEAYFNQPILDLLAGMSEQYGKKILITETGFRSVDGIATRPFDFNLLGNVDLQEQADAYEALFTSLQQGAGEFLDGIFLWEWDNDGSATDGTVERASGYELANKPAVDLVDDFFNIA